MALGRSKGVPVIGDSNRMHGQYVCAPHRHMAAWRNPERHSKNDFALADSDHREDSRPDVESAVASTSQFLDRRTFKVSTAARATTSGSLTSLTSLQ